MTWIARLALALIVALFVGGAVRHAAGTTWASSDEAGSILASKEILSTGLPRVPSQKIYYRSLLPHYLSALSIAVAGDNPLGWRGASLLAYALLLIVPALMLMRRGPAMLGPCWALLAGSPAPMLAIAVSGRMYLIYTFFSTMAVLLAVLWQPLRWNWQGWVYFWICAAVGLSHEHFVVFLPGLMLCALLTLIKNRNEISLARFCLSPMPVAPLFALAVAVFIHFSEPLIPNVFENYTSGLRLMGGDPSWIYPLTILRQSPVSPLLVLLLFLAASRRGIGTSVAFPIILLTSYVAVALMLPAAYSYYILPLWPVFLLAVFGFLIRDEAERNLDIWPPLSTGAAVLLIVFASGAEASIEQRARSFDASYSFLVDPPVSQENRWARVRQFALATNATIITSDPEILLLHHIGPVAAHVRALNVPAATPCSVVMDDYMALPFVHHNCQLDDIVQKAGVKNTPVLFLGSRLSDAVGVENARSIQTRFTKKGTVEDLQIYCIGPACGLLTTVD